MARLATDQALADGLVRLTLLNPMPLLPTRTAGNFTRRKGTAKGGVVLGEATTARKWVVGFDLREEANEAAVESRREVEQLMLVMHGNAKANLTLSHAIDIEINEEHSRWDMRLQRLQHALHFIGINHARPQHHAIRLTLPVTVDGHQIPFTKHLLHLMSILRVCESEADGVAFLHIHQARRGGGGGSRVSVGLPPGR